MKMKGADAKLADKVVEILSINFVEIEYELSVLAHSKVT